MRSWPALDVGGTTDWGLLVAVLDDFAPTAVEERTEVVRLFFLTTAERDRALTALAAAHYVATAIDVDDEDWAARSQRNLGPISVGRVTVAPPWSIPQPPAPPQSPASSLQPLVVIVEPSMGFGTGHHATTRLCLAALQTMDLTNRHVLDVGTGSGVLAIAADRLGAARVVGIDNDPDAVRSARDNLVLNPAAIHVEFLEADLAAADLPASDVVTANLTGALLARAASALLQAVRPGGRLIVSGLLAEERSTVVEAFSSPAIAWEEREDEWVALVFQRPQ